MPKIFKTSILILSIGLLVPIAGIIAGVMRLGYAVKEQFFIIGAYTLMFMFSYLPNETSFPNFRINLQKIALMILIFWEIMIFFQCAFMFLQKQSPFPSEIEHIDLICKTINQMFHFFLETLPNKFKDWWDKLPLS